MAYGIDYEGIYYTDHARADLGMLTTYDVSLDLADEKDFEIKAEDFKIPEDGWFYILNTEIGGIIDKIDSDSSEGQVKYTGRSFRGIIDSYIVETRAAKRILQGDITAVINEQLTEHGIDYMRADAADVDSSINTVVDAYEVTAGDTVYSAIMGAAASIDMTIAIEWQSDHLIHIIPILKQDFTDYLKYSGINAAEFQMARDHARVNHLVMTSLDNNGQFRRIDMFTNSDNTVQPYRLTETPYQASDYILDQRSKVLSGLDEIADWKECDDSPVDKYRQIVTVPVDWDTNYGNYYYKDTQEDSDGTVEISYKNFEGVESDEMTLTTSEPADWVTKYADYYTTSYDQATGQYTYSAVAGDSQIDPSTATAITVQPFDWSYNFGQYYYYWNTGTGRELRSYASSNKNKFVRMTSKPSDWNTNFGSYYRKVYKKITYTGKGKNKKKHIKIVDCLDRADAYYIACTKTDDKKTGKIPSFSKRPHYRKDSVDVIPKFDASNTYHCMTSSTAPAWEANRYYSGKKTTKAPGFDSANAFELMKDHYEKMCEAGLEYFAGLKAENMRAITIDDFSAHIGDIVGGTDKITGMSVVAAVSNINISIEKGIITNDYEIGGN